MTSPEMQKLSRTDTSIGLRLSSVLVTSKVF